MATRFPQGTGNLAYQIKAAYASKIHAIYWAVGADVIQRLRVGETATTPLTRAATGATFDANNGRIAGSTGSASDDYFVDSKSGGYQMDAADYTFGVGVYGDMWGGVTATQSTCHIISVGYDQTFSSGHHVSVGSSEIQPKHKGGNWGTSVPGLGDATETLETYAMRYVAADATAKSRMWRNGSEYTTARSAAAPTGTNEVIGDASRPIYLGFAINEGANKKVEWEHAWFGTGLMSDADLDEITNPTSGGPAIMIEAVTVQVAPRHAQSTLGRSARAAATSRAFRRFG